MEWLTPIWWTEHRQGLKAAIRTRVYSHICDGTESGSTVTFYIDSTNSGGTWIAHIYRVQNWYEATAGLAMAEFVKGDRPGPLVHGWGRRPTLFIAANAAFTSVSGGSLNSSTSRFPESYHNNQTNFLNGSVNGFDAGLHTAIKLDVAESDAPTTFGGFEGFEFNESTLFAVRGFNGPHVVLPTLKNPSQFEASPGRFVTVEDVASQDEQRAIRSHVNPSNLFADEADAEAYGESVLATYSDDRPIVSISFRANKTAAYRNQAIRRRVGDKVHLVANNTGPLGSALGIEGDFFIESVNHRFTGKRKVWDTTWELSPA